MNTLLLILFALAVCTAARAADWSWQPGFDWRVDHQSNRLLSTAQADAGQATWLSFGGAIQRATTDTELSLSPRLTVQRFSEQRDLDSEDGSLALAGKWLREYSQFAASALVSRDSTLATELAETGIVDLNTRRDLRTATASWTWSFAPTTQLDTQFGYTDVEYPDGRRVGLVGYRYPNGSLGLTRQLSDYTSVSLTAYGSRVEAPAALTISRSLGLQIGMARALSPDMQLQLSVGFSDTQRSNPFASRSDRSQLWNAQLTRKLQSGQWSFVLERSLAPNGLGVLASRDEASIDFARMLSANFTGSLSVHGIRNAERSVGPFSGEDYRYGYAEAALSRSFLRDWALRASLGGSEAQHRSIADTSAHGWYAALALHWAPAARPVAAWELP